MAQETHGPQKAKYSLRAGSPALPQFFGEETDGDDPASIRAGAFRTFINARRLTGRSGGSIGPRGGLSKVNTSALGSPVYGLHLNGDGFGVPALDGFCGSNESALIWLRGNEHYVLYYLGTTSFCAVMPSDQTFGVNHVVGRPRWGLDSGLGSTFYAPGSSDIAAAATKMRVSRTGRGPYPLIGSGVYGTPLSPLITVTDPTTGSPGSGFYSLASLLGTPNIGGTGAGEQFFLGWSKRDGAVAGASNFHVYRYEANSDDTVAPVLVGESLFSTTDQGHVQLWATPKGEIVALLNAPDHAGNYPQTNRLRYRNVSGTWADLPAIDISGMPVFGGGTLASIRNIVAHDAKVSSGKLWIAITGSAFNSVPAKFGNPKGFLLSWDGTTLKAERVVGADTASNFTRVVTLDAQFGKLWYGWEISTASPDTNSKIGSYDGTTFNDSVVDFFSTFDQPKIRHLIFAAGRWWALLKATGGIISPATFIGSTTDPSAASGWAIFASISNPLHEPNFDTGTPLSELVGEQAISDIQVL